MVERLGVEAVPSRSRLKAPREVIHQTITAEPSTMEVVLAAFTGLGYALSARGLLLLSLLGAFVLAVRSHTIMDLCVMVAFSVLVVIPVVYLEVRKR